jgi:hypothetical protein
MRLMHQAVEDGIGQRRVADRVMPMLHRQLAGDNGRARPMAVIEDLQQIPTALVGQGASAQSSITRTSVFANCASDFA